MVLLRQIQNKDKVKLMVFLIQRKVEERIVWKQWQFITNFSIPWEKLVLHKLNTKSVYIIFNYPNNKCIVVHFPKTFAQKIVIFSNHPLEGA